MLLSKLLKKKEKSASNESKLESISEDSLNKLSQLSGGLQKDGCFPGWCKDSFSKCFPV